MKNISLARLLAFSVYMAALAVAVPAALSQTVDPPADHPYAASQPIPGRYIVVFKAHVANPAAEAANLMRGTGGQLHYTYTSAIKGFAATLPDAAVQALRNNPNVDYVEQDQRVSLNETALSPPVVQNNATWGLDRIDQRDLPLDRVYSYRYKGADVYAFIIDTGIYASHNDFKTTADPASATRVNAEAGYTAINDGKTTNDCHGHGTHVAGTIGGLTWGVVKGVSLIPVRVLDCDGYGTWSGVIGGVDFVTGSTSLRPAVANMSLGGGGSTSVDTAVKNAVASGVTVVVAAGNSSFDACYYSPAREPSAITVGATTSTDKRASYSNYGKCLDLFAPGSSITSASISDPDAATTKSGTSMASPHVAGVAALALAANGTASPATVAKILIDNATKGVLKAIGKGSPNRLLYSLEVSATYQTIAVSSMTSSATGGRGGWNASATVTVRQRNSDWSLGEAAAGATVTGSFSPGGSASCVTDQSGNCTLTSATIRNTDTTKATVTGVSGPLMSYDASQNTVTEVVVTRP